MDLSIVTSEAYREIFHSMSEGLIMVDEAGKIAIANPVAEQLFGYQKDELIGLQLENLLPERYRKGQSSSEQHLMPILTHGEWGLEGI